MAKTKKEEVVESTAKQEQPTVDNEVGKIKVKKKPSMKKFNEEESVTKIDLSSINKVEDDTEEIIKVKIDNNNEDKVEDKVVEQVVEEIVEDKKEETTIEQPEEQPVIEEVTSEEKEIEEVKEEVVKAVEEAEATGTELPENIQKLMDFMEETGGDLEDYVKLNKDINKLDDDSVLREYYEQTKPHLTGEEISFLIEDSFSYDEEVDEERDVKRKKLAFKEQVADARAHLDGQKSKYYEEIKAGSKLTSEQQKAIDFFNRYNKESEVNKKRTDNEVSVFKNKTNKLFNDKFKGFEYNVGDKKFRFNVKDPNSVKDTQSDINNFVRKFLDKDGTMNNAAGYHKSLYTAMNADAVAKHFYEQGKADAMKESVAKAKNINMDPRQQHSGEVNTSGVKARILGDSTSDFKFKIKNNK